MNLIFKKDAKKMQKRCKKMQKDAKKMQKLYKIINLRSNF